MRTTFGCLRMRAGDAESMAVVETPAAVLEAKRGDERDTLIARLKADLQAANERTRRALHLVVDVSRKGQA